MSKLINLINSLKAYTVIIIENAFRYEDNPESILGKFCFLTASNRQKILETLSQNGYEQLCESLTLFYNHFSTDRRDYEKESALPASIYFRRYVSDIYGQELQVNELIEQINEAVQNDEGNVLKEALLKYGIYNIAEADYDLIISEVSKNPRVQILIYKNDPAEDEVETFFSDLDRTCSETGSSFCLAIVDKRLGNGTTDEGGKDFIIRHIIPENKKTAKKIVCCLFTSQPNLDTSLNKYNDYFIQEIGKDTTDKVENIAKTLARSAYAEVFNKIRVQHRKSAKKALNTVLKNQQNIKYILNESNSEGILPYQSIRNWFELAQQKAFENLDITNFKFIANLTSFFHEDYLEDHSNIEEIGEELKALNAFELFDFNVNKKYSPIAPGDIWQAGEEYYILLGQLCDMLLRQKDNKRNARLGELLKIDLIDYREKGLHKYDIDITGNKKYIYIENFVEPGSNNYKTLKIEISTPNIFFADLKVLDLAMFNSEGKCEIDITADLDKEIKNVLPVNKDSYYENLQNEYKSRHITLEKNTLGEIVAFSPPLDMSLNHFLNHNSIYSHGISRVGRLKGRYFDSLYNNYINHKSRIDLNLIDNSIETARPIQLNYKLKGFDDFKTVALRIWTKKGKEYIKMQDFQKNIDNELDELLTMYNGDIQSDDISKFELTKIDENIYQLELYTYLTTQRKYHSKDTINYSQLFGGKPTNNRLRFMDTEDELSFIDEHGSKVSFKISDLTRGMLVYDKSQVVFLENGIIKSKEI